MEAFGNRNANADKTQDLKMGLTNGNVTGAAFIKGYKQGDPHGFPKPTGDSFASAGGSLGIQGPRAGAGVEVARITNFGHDVTKSVNVNIMNKNDHSVDAHAFRTTHVPKVGHNSTTQGAGLSYKHEDIHKAGIDVSTTSFPAARVQRQNVSGSVNLHSTPTSSLDMNFGASRWNTPFGRGNWQSGGHMSFRKQF